MSRYYYEVKACRRVRVPEAGPEAHYIDSKRVAFSFGKGGTFRTGREAQAAAEECATALVPLSSDVSIWRLSGGGGTGTYIKDSRERFDSPWEPA
jgi:hypothetical protein